MCGLCEQSQSFLILEGMKGVCIPCMVKVKKFNVSAPNPFEIGDN